MQDEPELREGKAGILLVNDHQHEENGKLDLLIQLE
jgi:hypothetical protein